MSTEDDENMNAERSRPLSLEAISTVKGLSGPAAKPKNVKSVKSAKTAKKPAVKKSAAKEGAPKTGAVKRTRRASLNAESVIRARSKAAQADAAAEDQAGLENFEDAFPLPDFLKPKDPDAPRTGPAKLPDLPLIEQLEAEMLLNIPKRKAVKKRPLTPGASIAQRLTALVKDSLADACDHLLGRTTSEFMLVPLNPVRVIVALSGGRDSMALMDILSRIAKDKKHQMIAELRAVYVHHGLERDADAWGEHCRAECAKRGVAFDEIRVRVERKGEGTEAAARDARYRALALHAIKHDCSMVVTAHHEDDRIETFLLQWMRGCGLEGLAAFPEVRELAVPSPENAPAVREREQVFLLRPWMNVPRRDIERYVKNRRIAYVDDPSNNSPKYSRNRVRNEVLPLLESIRPGFRAGAARSVSLVAEALEVLKSLARKDLEDCRSEENPHGLSLYRLFELIPARQAWCLRAWLASEGLKPLSKARLDDLLRQLAETHSDATFVVNVQGKEIRRWGADLIVRDCVIRRADAGRDKKLSPAASDQSISLPQWGGAIELIPCKGDEDGIARSRLTDPKANLEVRTVVGSAKIKLWTLRPSKATKDLYAQAGIPAYARTDLPKLWLDGRLLFAAGLGMDVRFFDNPKDYPDRVRFLWHPDHSLWDTRALPNFAELADSERKAREERVREAARASLEIQQRSARADSSKSSER